MWEWLYEGCSKYEHDWGAKCINYFSPHFRTIETVIAVIIAILLIGCGYFRKPLPDVTSVRKDKCLRRTVLIVMCIIFGMELAYKFANNDVIYVLNPCHITTVIQIYLLAAVPNKAATSLFRVQLNLLNGPILAFVFPEAKNRVFACEYVVYWVQHGMLLVVPYILLRLGGEFNIEKPLDMTWCAMIYGFNVIYHFCILQGVGVLTGVNLSHMLCPSVYDPFGKFYRTAALIHQCVMCPLICKLYCIVATFCIRKWDYSNLSRRVSRLDLT